MATTRGKRSKPARATPDLDALQEAVRHRFADRSILERALIHRSYAHEKGTPGHDSELLEFLGDAVLALAVSRLLLKRFPEAPVGDLARRRAFLVSETNLARKARSLRLGDSLRLGRGEERNGGRDKDSLLADAYEAVLGAIYLDGGSRAAGAVIARQFRDQIAGMRHGSRVDHDSKTDLQEALQGQGLPVPVYRVTGEKGPDHRKLFSVDLVIADRAVAHGSGTTKKAAERMAARQALRDIARLIEKLKGAKRPGGKSPTASA